MSVVGQALSEAVEAKPAKRKPLEHIPNVGFLIVPEPSKYLEVSTCTRNVR